MRITLNSIEVNRTKQTKNNEPIYSALTELHSPYGVFEAVFLFTRTGFFLLKHGHPLVKFRDFDKSCGHQYGIGQTNYQKLLYNRMIEKLGDIKTQVTSYLMQNEFIDPLSLRKRDPRLYHAAKQLKELSFK